MNTEKKILEILENSQSSVSGEALAEILKVSRSTVWKNINSLRADGYKITASTNKGYILSPDNQVLSEPGIKQYLKSDCKITVYKAVSSTNILAKKAAESKAAEGCVIVAENQTAGKGRLGRKFFSPAGSGLYMSIVLRPDLFINETALITTAAAVAVSRAIDEICSVRTSIKWVNDIFLSGKKICGILTEGSVNLENGKMDYAVLGIGINVSVPDGGFPEEIKGIAGSIYQSRCNAAVKSRLAAAVIDNFFEIYRRLPNRSFMEEYRKKSLVIGREIKFVSDGKEFYATVNKIDDNAHLIVTLKDGKTKEIGAGEVSVKL